MTEKALPLLDDENARQKLYLRKAKAQFHTLDLENAKVTSEHLLDASEKIKLQDCISIALASRVAGRDVKAVHSKIVTEIPRIKPQIRTVPEYFVFGHDIPESLYETALGKTGRKKIALMFGGIGDGRHLLASLMGILAEEGLKRIEADTHYHFTIVDHKPAVIARNMIILSMLGDLASTIHRGENTRTQKLMATLYYIFLAPIMPPTLHAILQANIQEVISSLEERNERHSFLDLPQTYRAEVLRVLREWQHEVGEQYPPSKLRPKIVQARIMADSTDNDQLSKYMDVDNSMPRAPSGCKKQEEFYRKTAILTLTGDGRGHGADLKTAFDDLDLVKSPEVSRDMLSQIEATWKTNPTMIDLDYEKSREHHFNDQDLCHNPFSFGEALVQAGFAMESGSGLLSYLHLYFVSAANAISTLGDRLKIEACVGDVTSILEQIRFGMVGHRQQAETPAGAEEESQLSHDEVDRQDQVEDLSEYPKVYDKIHLSNIPDYVGGSLSTFMYALPVVHAGPACYATSNCLRNPPRFKTHSHYNNEYVALSAPNDLKKTFQVRSEIEDWRLDNPIILTEYIHYHHEPEVLTSATRMPRDQLETWLFRLFLKLAIPKDRDLRNYVLVYSPLNLTAFLRLCGHLHNIGYPAHWISGVLEDICSGKITTKARPPRSEPLSIKEVKADMPALQQSTAPFVAELSTLLGLWQLALPFGVLSTSIPRLDLIRNYNITFENVSDLIAEPAHFVLIIFDVMLVPHEIRTLRPYILSDELGDQSQKAARARENVHIISTWDWDAERKTAKFWLRSDTMEALQASGRWAMQIWRVDGWTFQSKPRRLTSCLDRGLFWADAE